MKKLWSILAVLVVAVFLTACSDSTSNDVTDENKNTPSETNNSSATRGYDMSDLAVVELISAEWALTGHASTDNPLNYAGTRDGCQPCHSGNGFAQFLTDDPFTPEADEEDENLEAHLPSTMDCATCHTGVGRDMLATGIAPAEYVPFMNEDFDVGTGSALCIACHNGRRDTVSMYEEWASGEGKPTAYPHYDAGALYSGQGGMEYPDVNYSNSIAHQIGGCVSCHMPVTEEGYVSHDFGMNVADLDTACASCHENTSEFAVGGNLQAELDKLLEELHDAAVAAVEGAVAIGTGRTTFPFVDAAGEVVDLDNVSTEAYVAAYNYYLVKSDKSGGAHNPRYAKSLLVESLEKLK